MSKGQNRNRVIGYLKKHPKARTTDVADALKINASYVSTIRNLPETRQTLAIMTHKPVQGSENSCFNMSIDIGSTDVSIKILKKGKMVGTLNISDRGLSYKKANTKKDNGRRIGFNIIEKLAELGIVS